MRDLILKILKQEKHISGQELGQRLNISRTAVWKHINELRSRGYRIDSSPRSGYSYIRNTPLLLSEEIIPGLDTQIMGRHILHYDEVSSTQDIAIELANEGGPEGTVVITEMQTKGRGRKGRRWVSLPGGGIYLSLILRPNLMPSRVIQIPLIAGVALIRAIKKITSLQPAIKWPNDIIIGKRKVGGILTEMSSEIDGVNYVVLGIGLNVNLPASLLAEQTSGTATSLVDEYGQDISRAKLVQGFLSEFEKVYNRYLAFGFTSVKKEWLALNNTIGSPVKVSDGINDIEGRAVDIDDDGFLLVRNKNGDICRIISGDVFITG